MAQRVVSSAFMLVCEPETYPTNAMVGGVDVDVGRGRICRYRG